MLLKRVASERIPGSSQCCQAMHVFYFPIESSLLKQQANLQTIPASLLSYLESLIQ